MQWQVRSSAASAGGDDRKLREDVGGVMRSLQELVKQNDELRKHSARAGEVDQRLSGIRQAMAQIAGVVTKLKADTEQIVRLDR